MNIGKKCILAISVMVLTSGCAFADGNAFTPLNFDDTAYSVPNSTTTTKTTNTVNTVQQSNSSGFVDTSAVNASQATGNADLQTAIAKIDTALDDIRADQNVCKAKYADVDNQYKFIKNERSNLKKQVRANEKRIKELTKAKSHLGKNVL